MRYQENTLVMSCFWRIDQSACLGVSDYHTTSPNIYKTQTICKTSLQDNSSSINKIDSFYQRIDLYLFNHDPKQFILLHKMYRY